MLGAVPREPAGMASSTNLTARLAGGVVGIAILALLPTGTSGPAYARQFTADRHAALITAAGVGVTGAILAATLIPATRNAACGSPCAYCRPRHRRRQLR
jgi:hypothetical protein